jgi:amino acid adenylation domain-containing protein
MASGVGTGDLVAVAVPRSLDSIVALYAVVQTGAAYLPIDPDHPADRTEYVLADAGPSLVITGPDGLAVSSDLVQIDLSSVDLSTYPSDPVTDAERSRTLLPGDIAYVIYTSGSTGRPKGVALPHRAVANQIWWMQSEFALTVDDAMVQKTPSTFDLSVWELWWPLTTGARLVVANAEGNRDPVYLARLMRDERVTVADFVPSLLGAFTAVATRDDVAALRAVVCIGEALPRDVVTAFARLSDAPVINLYGPTEAAVSATAHRITAAESGVVPIGAPEANVRVYVLDDRLRPVPQGVMGELYLSGVQLARGYHRRPGLTSERFVAHPFGEGRLYRTGDAVRWSAGADGPELEFVARTDDQVKVRGFRIELGEVESALTSADGVSAAAAAVKRIAGGDVLIGYAVPEAGSTVDVDAVRETMRGLVPAYMVPARIVVIDELPLSVNGKLDRRLLPAVDASVTREYRAPSTPVEEAVADAFASVLGLQRVGVDDNFFELGGNSLSATRVIARINARLGTSVGIREMFETADVAGFAARVESATSDTRAPLVARERPDRIPLSLAQQRMWFLNQFDTVSPAYNVPLAVRLTGPLDVDALVRAVQDVVARHESLRTYYPQDELGPFQKIVPAAELTLDFEQDSVAEDRVRGRLVSFVARGFDVTAGVPVRGLLLETGADSHVLMIVMHHISADGFSVAPLARDVMIAYGSRSEGNAPVWSPLEVQYADYTLWQRDVLGSVDDPDSVLAEQLSYWKESMAGLDGPIELPFDRPRPEVQSMSGHEIGFFVPARVMDALQEVCRGSRATLFMGVHAAFSVLLSKLGNTRDVVVGTPIAGRGDEALDHLVGMFVNTLALRLDVDPDLSFVDLVRSASAVDLGAFANADVPFENVVEAVDPERSTAFNPLFQVGFSFQNLAPVQATLSGLEVAALEPGSEISQYDLHLVVAEGHENSEYGRGLEMAFTYATSLFDEATVQSFADRLLRVLESVAFAPDTRVRDIEIMSDDERSVVVVERNRTEMAGVPPTVTEMLDRQFSASPDDTAIVAGDVSLTYREFDERVQALARYLIAHSVGPGDLVAVAIPRSFDMMIALHAIVRSGAAYLPIDLEHPPERTRYVLANARPRGVLTVSPVVLDLDETGCSRVDVDTLDLDEFALGPIREEERTRPITGDDLMYVIYTSGSTGKPKGVAVGHSAVANQLAWMTREYSLSTADAVIQKTPVTFDVSVWELWWPLTAGATVVLAKPGGQSDSLYIADLIRTRNVTVAVFVPSPFVAFLTVAEAADVASVRAVLCAGEALPRDSVDAFGRISDAQVDNLYGPTEAAVTVTRFSGAYTGTSSSIPIGRPAANTSVYVLDGALRPVPDGVVGELYLAGDQLAWGYFGRTELTADRFVANPFEPGRMYRTGDAVRWTTAGDIEYIGRTDDQVKVRGFRIELGEVEKVLASFDGVTVAAAAVKRFGGSPALIGYVVPQEGSTVDLAALEEFAGTRLPSYMVPSRIVVIDAIPLGASGKMDRKSLPSPEMAAQREYRAPSTPIEAAFAEAFASVLGVDRVGVDDNFFDLGGNSLSATKLLSTARASEAIERDVPLQWIFTSPTPATLAAKVEAGSVGDDKDALGVLLPIRTTGSQAPLFCFHPIVGLAWSFTGLASRLSPEIPIYGIQTPALSGDDTLEESITAVAERYLAEIRTVQSEGPYRLLGWSFGGTVAQTVASMLREAGETVELVAILDSRGGPAPTEASGEETSLSLAELLGALGVSTEGVPDVPLGSFEEAARMIASAPAVSAVLDERTVELMLRGAAHNGVLMERHQPAHFDGTILFFAAGIDDPSGRVYADSWLPYADVVDAYSVPVTHWSMTTDAAWDVIVPVIRRAIGG